MNVEFDSEYDIYRKKFKYVWFVRDETAGVRQTYYYELEGEVPFNEQPTERQDELNSNARAELAKFQASLASS